MDQADTLRKFKPGTAVAGALRQHVKGIAVASGKGGVGKTNIVANLALELSRRGNRVMIFDADMGLGNIHILLGLAPRFNVAHVLTGAKKLRDILVEGPNGIKILPASTGNKKYSELSTEEKLVLKSELEVAQEDFDYILFDIGAGISANVMFFCSAAQDVVVIASPEPTSFSDAYAMMKVLSRDYMVKTFRLIVNSCRDRIDATNIYKRLVMVSDKFALGIKIDFLGHIALDPSVGQAVRKQRLFADLFPGAEASKNVAVIAETLIKTASGPGDMEWDNIFRG
ncbi:MAG: MinD/ParA family protein [Nitrospinae bacterium]|nr:MinD/ParA family protein [Nitrospinota bacterium]